MVGSLDFNGQPDPFDLTWLPSDQTTQTKDSGHVQPCFKAHGDSRYGDLATDPWTFTAETAGIVRIAAKAVCRVVNSHQGLRFPNSETNNVLFRMAVFRTYLDLQLACLGPETCFSANREEIEVLLHQLVVHPSFHRASSIPGAAFCPPQVFWLNANKVCNLIWEGELL